MPSPHSQTSHYSSPHNDSDRIDPKSGYALGNYEFSVEADNATGGPAMEITARCKNTITGKIGTKTKQFDSGTILLGWYVEANGTTADVYAVIGIPKDSGQYTSDLDTGNIAKPISGGGSTSGFIDTAYYSTTLIYNGNYLSYLNYGNWGRIRISTTPSGSFTVTSIHNNKRTGVVTTTTDDDTPSSFASFTHNGKTAYFSGAEFLGGESYNPSVNFDVKPSRMGEVAWTVLYGTPASPKEYDEKEVLIGRFAIDSHEAGSGPEDTLDDPDDEWDEPEDYDPEEDPIEYGDSDYPDPDDPDYPDPIEYGDSDYPDPDDPDYPDPIYPDDPDYPDPDDPDYPGDQDDDGEPDPYHPEYHPDYYPPTKTLYLKVIGALSGRHNDPLNDTSYSYVPADKATIKNPGYGGDGGNGGGGGAGASTVIVHKFATSKANLKEITAIARRHGYGSGGGKGGKGGSGCILIYY